MLPMVNSSSLSLFLSLLPSLPPFLGLPLPPFLPPSFSLALPPSLAFSLLSLSLYLSFSLSTSLSTPPHTLSLKKKLAANLHEEEGDSIGTQGAAELNVAELRIQFTHFVQFAMLTEDQFLYTLYLHVLSRQELRQVQETWLVLGLAVVAIGNLALDGGKLYGFLAGAGMGPFHNGISRLRGR